MYIYSMLVVAVACYIMQLVLFQKDTYLGLYGFFVMVCLSTVSKQRLIFSGRGNSLFEEIGGYNKMK